VSGAAPTLPGTAAMRMQTFGTASAALQLPGTYNIETVRDAA